MTVCLTCAQLWPLHSLTNTMYDAHEFIAHERNSIHDLIFISFSRTNQRIFIVHFRMGDPKM